MRDTESSQAKILFLQFCVKIVFVKNEKNIAYATHCSNLKKFPLVNLKDLQNDNL